MIDISAGSAADRAARPLDAINFFLADVRDGLGPYLAIYRLRPREPRMTPSPIEKRGSPSSRFAVSFRARPVE